MKICFFQKFSLALVIAIVLTGTSVYAGEINLDGIFDDWNDKPGIEDTVGDDIPIRDLIRVKWYPDVAGDELYLFLERLAGDEDDKNKPFEDWNINGYITGEEGTRKLVIRFHPPSHQVDVTLYDNQGGYLWSEKGKWGDPKDLGKKIEFGIPMDYLAASAASGYKVEVYFSSNSDRVPENGIIMLSTVSTFPAQAVILLFFPAVGLFILWRRKRAANRLEMKV